MSSNRAWFALVQLSVVSVLAIGCAPKQTTSPPAGTGQTPPPDVVPALAEAESTAERGAKSSVAEKVAPGAGESAASGWGNLRGRFVFDGAPPERKPLAITKDVEVCGKHKVVDESLVVNAENKGLANVVISLYVGRDDKAPAVHESYNATADDKVSLDNVKCRFHPHVVMLRTSQTLLIGNLDEVGHNTKIDTFKNPQINEMTPSGASLEQKYTDAEQRPARVSCNIHPWMTGWIVIRDDPYAAVTDDDGKFQIENLPAGKWTLQAWQEAVNYLTDVTLAGKKTEWKRGRFEVDIKAGETTDLGDVLVSPELFGQ